MSKAKSAKPSPKWKALVEELTPKLSAECPKVTILLPTHNCAHTIAYTLDSILGQEYPELEVIAIDRNSTDRTVPILKGYRDPRLKIYTAAHSHLYETLNWGISLAGGDYINILFSGDFYLSKHSTERIMGLAIEEEEPDLVFAASMIRIRHFVPRVLHRPFTLRWLKQGMQPTNLESCWIKKSALVDLGKFSPKYHSRGGFDLMCRFRQKRRYRYANVGQVLTDQLPRSLTYAEILTHFKETAQVISKHFGFWHMCRWMVRQRDVRRMLSRWWRGVKAAFSGSR